MSAKRNIRGLLAQVLGNRCENCGSIERLEIDHVIPLSKGGTDTIDNVALLCFDCHKEKHYPPKAFIERQDRCKKPIKKPIPERISLPLSTAFINSPLLLGDNTLAPFDHAHLRCYLLLGGGKWGVQAIQLSHDNYCQAPSCFLKGDGLIRYARLRGLTTATDDDPTLTASPFSVENPDPPGREMPR